MSKIEYRQLKHTGKCRICREEIIYDNDYVVTWYNKGLHILCEHCVEEMYELITNNKQNDTFIN